MQQMENAAHLRRRYHDVDLVVSCGDLPAPYLDFITSILSVPLYYIKGNHDEAYLEEPPGGEDLHMSLHMYKGLSFVGLEGSIRYNSSPVKYTEGEMMGMVMKMGPRMRYRRWRHGHGVDVLVTHAPPQGIHDAPDLPHNGFRAFLRFMDWYRPRFLLHGHVHTYDRRATTETEYLDTRVMNINPLTVVDIEPSQG